MVLADYIDGIAALGISSAAAALSSTLIRSELLPEQLSWLGTAGTVVAAVMIAISFVLRKELKSQSVRIVLIVLLLVTCTCLIWLRAARVKEIILNGAVHKYLVGAVLARSGEDAWSQCKADSVEQLLQCSGSATIPKLYGRSYDFVYYSYVFDYLLLLACFVSLIAGLELKHKV